MYSLNYLLITGGGSIELILCILIMLNEILLILIPGVIWIRMVTGLRAHAFGIVRELALPVAVFDGRHIQILKVKFALVRCYIDIFDVGEGG